MARYTGPRLRKVRALDADLPGLTAKRAERRPYPPGQHGFQRRPKKQTDYKRQLVERQKLRFNYGVSETQLRRIVLEARRMKGRADENVLVLLEWRLDNLVFRAGLAPTIPAARQLIVHGHVLVDGKRLDRPSARLKVNSVIGVAEAKKTMPVVAASWQRPRFDRPACLEADVAAMTVKLVSRPDPLQVLLSVQTQLVIEHYATRI